MSFNNLESFYKSKEWTSFRKLVIEKRTTSNGYVICDLCGKPILKKYDLILHHKQELSESNVGNYNISLNEDNIEILHFKCHNERHCRFTEGHASSYNIKKKVFIIYGSPCAGKTTWVHSVATKDDLVVDLDSIWQMISINNRYDKPTTLKSVVFEMRDKMYDIIKYRSGKWHNAYIITGGALKGDRDRLIQRVGADECILIDTDVTECLKRLYMRTDFNDKQKEDWKNYIIDWFSSYQPDETNI